MHQYSVQGTSVDPKKPSSPVQVLQTNKPHQAAKLFLDSLENLRSKSPIHITFNHIEVTNVKGKTIKYYIDVDNKKFFKKIEKETVLSLPPRVPPTIFPTNPVKRVIGRKI